MTATEIPDTTNDRVLLFDMDGIIIEGHGTDESVHDGALDDATDPF